MIEESLRDVICLNVQWQFIPISINGLLNEAIYFAPVKYGQSIISEKLIIQ